MSSQGGSADSATKAMLLAPGDLADRGGGAPMRWRALHSALSAFLPTEYYPVTCASPDLMCQHPKGDVQDIDGLEDPFATSYCPIQSEHLVSRVVAEAPSFVVASELRLHRYAEQIRLRTGVPVVDDMHNVEYTLRQELAAHRMASRYTEEHTRQIFAVEEKVLRQAAGVWVCSGHDRETLLKLHGSSRSDAVHVVSNAIPVTTATVPENEIEAAAFTGLISYGPNEQAVRTLVEEVLPLLRGAPSALPLVIAGARCPDWLSQAVETTPGLRVLPDPDDLSELIGRSALLIPLQVGGGTRFKVLEAFALGAPVVSTAKGVEGLGLVHGLHYLRADRPDEFAAAFERLRSDRALTRRLRTAGHELVTRRFSFQAVTAQVGAAISALPGPPSTGTTPETTRSAL
ncbi:MULTISPECIES: glycosyltransferase family 4 protein [Nocardiopsidaceae]|uniref:Glycosyltransferase family 4 protein n=1 Tax=Streptomonospora nanhaiensis TaxID=1323731 RepID=A0ABY6YQ15_9ACTN|nr:glycosyltransferase family 4 protein [Streptomonospora nanhaiensis]WAE74051.1 glycosyltransferase family 4 protein [Streptomonospora nanhaiensis]